LLPAQLLDEEMMWNYTAEIAEQEIEAQPGNVFAWFNLGVSLTRLGEIALEGNAEYYLAGADAFDQARTIGLPTRALWYEHRPFMAYWKTGRLEDVLELSQAMLDTVGGQYVEEIFWYRGHALIAQGDIAGARDAYEKALEVNPNFFPAQTSLDWIMSTYYGG
jgi:tetratricopeptide (TPR) repeat protein